MSNKARLLEGKVAIVTGAGALGDHASIGRMEAVRLAQEGAKVIVNNRRGSTGGPSPADNVVEQIRAAGGEAFANTDSVETFDGGKRIIESALDHFGRVDILVNNAGFVSFDLIWELSEKDFDDMIAVHLKGTFNTVRSVAPHFRRQNSGVIVNTSSNSGLGQYGNSAYAAAKEGVVGFTRSIARDLGPNNVRCNAIRPLSTSKIAADEKIAKHLAAAELEYKFPLLGDIWFTRMAPADLSPLHVANFAVWLCSDAAKEVNGMDFEIHGGRIGVLTAPKAERSMFRPEGWTIEDLNEPATLSYLVGSEKNRFRPEPSSDAKSVEVAITAHDDNDLSSNLRP